VTWDLAHRIGVYKSVTLGITSKIVPIFCQIICVGSSFPEPYNCDVNIEWARAILHQKCLISHSHTTKYLN